MPRYFLHLQEPPEVIRDEDGEELETLDLAIEEAKAAARELMAASLESGGPLGKGRTILIEDEGGTIVARVRFEDAIPPEK